MSAPKINPLPGMLGIALVLGLALYVGTHANKKVDPTPTPSQSMRTGVQQPFELPDCEDMSATVFCILEDNDGWFMSDSCDKQRNNCRYTPVTIIATTRIDDVRWYEFEFRSAS